MADNIDAAVLLLREAGWTCIPPVDPNAAIPEPAVGQVWRSPKPRVEPRTVLSVGAAARGIWPGQVVVGFSTPTRQPHEKWGPLILHTEGWRAWARKSGARPEATNG